MREIKFRVWITDWGNSTSHLEYIKEGCLHVYFGNWERGGYKNAIFQQFTGLKDKNGKEIYEGDILRDGNGFLYEVFWLDTSASFELAEKQELPDDYDILTFNFRNSFRLEVVDNIFENQKT